MAAKPPPPSTGAPAGVPPSGNTKFVVIAVLLLGAMIGAGVYFKMCRTPEQPPPLLVDAGPPPKPTGRNPDDDIPLPPPAEDAGPDGGKKVTIWKPDNQCGVKKCTGSSSPELEQALAMRAKQARKPCYDRALEQDQTLRGKVVLSVRVGAMGTTCSASVASNELANPNVAACAAGLFRDVSFPAPRGGCADVNIPINFVPR
jgi:hypothetical protein